MMIRNMLWKSQYIQFSWILIITSNNTNTYFLSFLRLMPNLSFLLFVLKFLCWVSLILQTGRGTGSTMVKWWMFDKSLKYVDQEERKKNR